MKRRFLRACSLLTGSLLMILMASGCGGQASSVAQSSSTASGSAADDTVYTCIVAHSMAEDSARHQSFLYFEEELEKRTGGRIQVEVNGNGVMGSDDELMDMCKMNTIQVTSGSGFEKANRMYSLYQMPFLFATVDEFDTVLKSDFEKRIQEGAKANGYYIPVTGVQGGFRQITNNLRPINTPDDIVGMKIRVPGLTPVVKTMEALGVNTQQIPYNDTYLALQTGVVDGQENPTANIVEKKFYEVQKYLSIVNYIICPECFFTNLSWYESLPADLQEIYNEVAAEAIEMRTEDWLASDDANIQLLSEQCEMNEVSAENLELFREKCMPVWQAFIDEGYFTQEDLDEVLSILGR